MQNIIKELYHYHTEFSDSGLDKNPALVKAARERDYNEDKLMETLNAEEKELFEKHCIALLDIEEIRQNDTYAQALKFGMLLMAEVFMGSE